MAKHTGHLSGDNPSYQSCIQEEADEDPGLQGLARPQPLCPQAGWGNFNWQSGPFPQTQWI